MNQGRKLEQIVKAFFVLVIACLFLMPVSASVINGKKNESTQRGVTDGGDDTLYVDDDNTAGPWDGTIEHPYAYIQDGIDHAEGGDTVYVFNGTYYENIVIFKSLLVTGENKDITIIDGRNVGTVVKIIAEGVVLTGFTITHSGTNENNAGVFINTPHSEIVANVIVKNHYGIHVVAAENIIYHNNFLKNTYQAYDEANNLWDNDYPCGGNYWSDYTGVDDNEDGIGDTPYLVTGYNNSDNLTQDRYPLIHPYGSVANVNTSEIFLTINSAIHDYDTEDGNVISVKNGRYCEHLFICKSLTLNGENTKETVIDGRYRDTVVGIYDDAVTLQRFTIQSSGAEEENAGIIIHSDVATITETIVKWNYHGIVVKHSEDTVIYKNVIKNNSWNGILLKNGCEGTIIVENTIEHNEYAGVGISSSSYNFVYHNSFMMNRHNAYDDSNNIWDDGYPSGGNYWSDYTGSDGDGDGIGDSPYSIPDGINKDRYPLMAPFNQGDTTSPTVRILSPQNGLYLRNLRLFPTLFKFQTIIFGAITIEAEAFDAQSGIDRVEFYLDNAMRPQAIDYTAPYSWTWKQWSPLQHQHTIVVVAYDKAGNLNVDILPVRRFF